MLGHYRKVSLEIWKVEDVGNGKDPIVNLDPIFDQFSSKLWPKFVAIFLIKILTKFQVGQNFDECLCQNFDQPTIWSKFWWEK